MTQTPISPFRPSQWQPAAYVQVLNLQWRAELSRQGYLVVKDFFSKDTITSLKNNFEQLHNIDASDGGMFVSLYSTDLAYRQRVHQSIADIVSPLFNEVFTDYKTSVYNYIVKMPGPQSELFIHQDIALVDENHFSPVSIWAPLEDLKLENGPMCVLPKSQYTIPPYRTLYVQQPFAAINKLVFSYMQPLLLNAGDLLVFDSRLWHNSLANTSAKPRVVIACSMFPAQAPFQFLYKKEGSATEVVFDKIELQDNFFLTYKNFISSEMERPDGKPQGEARVLPIVVNESMFLNFCASAGLVKNEISTDGMSFSGNVIQSYNTEKQSLLSKVKRRLYKMLS